MHWCLSSETLSLRTNFSKRDGGDSYSSMFILGGGKTVGALMVKRERGTKEFKWTDPLANLTCFLMSNA